MIANGNEAPGVEAHVRLIDFDHAIEKVKGAAGLCSSLSISAEAGRGKYACEGMAVLYDVLDSAVCEFEGLLA